MTGENLLEIRDLEVVYYQGGRPARAVRGIDLAIQPGSALAVVGESGSGKSTVALAVMRLIPSTIGDVSAGSIKMEGRELLALGKREMREVLRTRIGYVPQDPTSCLDPLFPVMTQIAESLPGVSRREQPARAAALLESLGVQQARERLRSYPHEFSGGMQQRVAIAIALARQPALLIADEPTTALDVTTQLGILELLDDARRSRGLSMLFITHDLSIARVVCQEAAVMYAGRIVETGPIEQVIGEPRHPYTVALVASIPMLADPRSRFRSIPGQPPSIREEHEGCPFAARCPVAEPRCAKERPPRRMAGAVAYWCWKG